MQVTKRRWEEHDSGSSKSAKIAVPNGPFAHLPIEITHKILTQLDACDLRHFGLACRDHRPLSQYAWHILSKREGRDTPWKVNEGKPNEEELNYFFSRILDRIFCQQNAERVWWPKSNQNPPQCPVPQNVVHAFPSIFYPLIRGRIGQLWKTEASTDNDSTRAMNTLVDNASKGGRGEIILHTILKILELSPSPEGHDQLIEKLASMTPPPRQYFDVFPLLLVTTLGNRPTLDAPSLIKSYENLFYLWACHDWIGVNRWFGLFFPLLGRYLLPGSPALDDTEIDKLPVCDQQVVLLIKSFGREKSFEGHQCASRAWELGKNDTCRYNSFVKFTLLKSATLTSSDKMIKDKVIPHLIKYHEELGNDGPAILYEVIGDAYKKTGDLFNAAKYYTRSVERSSPYLEAPVCIKAIQSCIKTHRFLEARALIKKTRQIKILSDQELASLLHQLMQLNKELAKSVWPHSFS